MAGATSGELSWNPRDVRSSTHATVVHVIRDLFAYICQLEEFSFCTNIVVLCGEVSVFSRLVS